MNEFFDPKLDNDIAKRLFGEKYEKSQFIENANLLKSEVEEAFISKMPESHPIYFDTLYNRVVKRVYQNSLLDGKCLRIDGRHEQDLRKIDMSIGNLNAHHGSAIFSRGLTSVLSLVTFGYEGYSLNENHAANMLIRDPFKTQNKFFLHYEFPAYCNGEVSKPNFGSGAKRRELGHGNLAQRALQYAVKKSIPDELFAIRALNKVLCSNGSSSMASVCASNLALQNAGLRFTENIAGIAMGLANIQPRKLNFDSIENNNFEDIDENFKPLTDITGIEDALGEIDLKIASSESKLVTSIQADVKSATGISDYVLRCLISRALKVNQNIAMSMKASVESSEQSKKLRFPIVKEISLPLGTRYRIQNSKVLIKLKDYAGSHLAFVENDINVDGKVKLFSPDSENLEKALQIIEELTSSYEYELELGAIYSVKVIKVQSIGLYVQIHPSFSPILISFSMLDTSIAPHLSKESKIKPKNDLSSSHELENMFKEGQELIVKYMGRDPINGKHLLSRRAIFMHGSNTIAHQSHYFKSLRDAMAESED